MQLGVRWRAGDEPHRSVPEVLHEAIRNSELRYPNSQAWTLTWLEGRPRAELDHVVLLSVDIDGNVQELLHPDDNDQESDDDSWLD